MELFEWFESVVRVVEIIFSLFDFGHNGILVDNFVKALGEEFKLDLCYFVIYYFGVADGRDTYITGRLARADWPRREGFGAAMREPHISAMFIPDEFPMRAGHTTFCILPILREALVFQCLCVI